MNLCMDGSLGLANNPTIGAHRSLAGWEGEAGGGCPAGPTANRGPSRLVIGKVWGDWPAMGGWL